MPRPAVNYLRRILHEREVNSYLEDFSHMDSIGFIRATLERMEITYGATGLDRLDPAGRYIFASNHPFGGLDGLMLAVEIAGRFGDVRVVVNDLLMNLEPLKSIFIPVNKHGRQSTEYAKMYQEAFDSNVPIVTFPAGLCSRREKGAVCDREWKPSFVKQAAATRRDIVPVYFDGKLSDFFYNLSCLRTKLGIGANVEMLYLAEEMVKQRGRHFEMIVGEPIPWQSLEGGLSARKTTLEIRRKAYGLGRE
jgi:putative hemolysin